MNLTIPRNKLHPQPQEIAVPHHLLMMIGENGCGKSAILEQVFQEYLENPEIRVICFTSGMNESYSPIFNAFVRESKRYWIDADNQDIDAAFNSFYFHGGWSKLLVFFATALKKHGRVRAYLQQRGYCDISEDGLEDDTSSMIQFTFRIDSYYIRTIQGALQNESENPEYKSIRKTIFHRLLANLAEHVIRYDFDFEKSQRRRNVWLAAKDIFNVFNSAKENEIFTFLSLATKNNRFIDLWRTELNLKALKMNDLSDGEFQLLTVYAILDLFDSENTIFLLDEIDSHLHYQNIQKLWTSLQNIQGRLLTTTHSADSIITNKPEVIRVVENGKIEINTTPLEIFKRLESLSDNDAYPFRMMGKLPYIALIDGKFDWVVFSHLAIKVFGDDATAVLDQITPIPCSSNYTNTGCMFGKQKIEWVKKLFERNQNGISTRHIFLICDKDELNSNDILNDGRVNRTHRDMMATTINDQAQCRLVSLLSWKRREIENYFLCESLLACHGLLDQIRNSVPPIHHASLSTGDNAGLAELDAKAILQPLYLKDDYANLATHEEGIDYNKVKALIDEIPAQEISDDIKTMFNYLRSKIQSHNTNP